MYISSVKGYEYKSFVRAFQPNVSATVQFTGRKKPPVDELIFSYDVPKDATIKEIPTDAKILPKESNYLSSTETQCNMEYAGKIIKDSKTGLKYQYAYTGFVVVVYDKEDRVIRHIPRKAYGYLCPYYHVYEYDKSGKKLRKIAYDTKNGSRGSYTDYEYDNKGNITRQINRYPDGSVDSYVDCEYDKSRNITREITRRNNGIVQYYVDYKYNAGEIEHYIIYNSDGKEIGRS